MAQWRHDPAFDALDGDLDLGLISSHQLRVVQTLELLDSRSLTPFTRSAAHN